MVKFFRIFISFVIAICNLVQDVKAIHSIS